MIKSGMQNTENKDNYLTIILEDGDEVLESLEQAFKERDVKKAILISATGHLRETRIAITRAGSIRQRVYSPSMQIKSVSGEFNRATRDYYGDVHISLYQDPIHIVSGILLKGYSENETKLVFKIINNDMLIGRFKDTSASKNLVKEKIKKETIKEKKPFIEA